MCICMPLFQRSPSNGIAHLGHTTIRGVVIFYPSSCFSLCLFNFIYVELGIWAPHKGGILHFGSNQSVVSSLSYALMYDANFSPYDDRAIIRTYTWKRNRNVQRVPALVAQLDARPTEDQEVEGSTPPVGNILSWRLTMKYFSPFRWFKKGSCQFLAKECA